MRRAIGPQINKLLLPRWRYSNPRAQGAVPGAAWAARSFGEHHAGSLVVEALVEFLSDYRDRPAPATSAWLTGLIMEALRGGMPPGEIYDWQLGNGGRSVMNGGDDSTAGSLSRLTGLLGPELHPGDTHLLALWFLSDPGTVRADPQVYRGVLTG